MDTQQWNRMWSKEEKESKSEHGLVEKSERKRDIESEAENP